MKVLTRDHLAIRWYLVSLTLTVVAMALSSFDGVQFANMLQLTWVAVAILSAGFLGYAKGLERE